MTFRKQAIATLKQLRTDGYTLNVKLNATNEALHAELVRLESLITAQELDLTLDLAMYSLKLEDINKQRSLEGQKLLALPAITSEQLDQHLKASKAYDERCKTFKAALNTELLLNRNQSLAMMLNQPPSFMAKAQTFITSTDWQHVANIMAALILPILYALLFTTILTGAFTFKALKLAHSKAKHLAPIWNFIKFHPSIQGGYRSELLELAFGLA